MSNNCRYIRKGEIIVKAKITKTIHLRSEQNYLYFDYENL